MPEFSTRLKDLRHLKGITQKQLAIDVNASERGIQNYELCERKPACEHLIKLANYFNVSTDYLLGLTDNPERNL